MQTRLNVACKRGKIDFFLNVVYHLSSLIAMGGFKKHPVYIKPYSCRVSL